VILPNTRRNTLPAKSTRLAVIGTECASAGERAPAWGPNNTKLNWVREFEATHTINAKELDVVETFQDSMTATVPTR
jgi:hypothetical protein